MSGKHRNHNNTRSGFKYKYAVLLYIFKTLHRNETERESSFWDEVGSCHEIETGQVYFLQGRNHPLIWTEVCRHLTSPAFPVLIKHSLESTLLARYVYTYNELVSCVSFAESVLNCEGEFLQFFKCSCGQKH